MLRRTEECLRSVTACVSAAMIAYIAARRLQCEKLIVDLKFAADEARAAHNFAVLPEHAQYRPVTMRQCHSYDEFDSLASAAHFEVMDVRGCPLLVDIMPLAHANRLQEALLRHTGIDRIAALQASTATLRIMDLEACVGVRDFSVLALMGALKAAHISFTAISDLAVLERSAATLKTLELDGAAAFAAPHCCCCARS